MPQSPARRTSASAARPTAAASSPPPVAPPAARANRRPVAYTALCTIACAAAFYAWRVSVEPPRFTDPVGRIGTFVAGPRFAKLPFGTQRAYMELLHAREDELREAYHAGRIREDDYRRAIEFAWFGKHLPRMDKFLTLSPTEQTSYLDKRLDKKGGGHKKKAGGGNGSGGVRTPARAASDPGLPADVRRDEASEKTIPRTWPDEWQERWEIYRDALKERRKAREADEDD